MTLEESREIIPLMESMIGQIEEQQNLMAEMILEMQNRDTQLSYAKTESEITKIKQRVIRAAQHFAKYRGTAFQDGRTENEDRAFENENQQWQKLAQKLNSENSLLLKQNTELLNWNSR